MDCVRCKENCCNNSLHELRNANVSLRYVVNRLRKGCVNSALIDRMEFEINRIDMALKKCIRRF